eukprot:CAMPEP_0194113838 /NCGR_PEP_ID=MMETSP0150-20130528/18057_1 /TAXON_ID=122233 /ORGANISM="Chaetoceros debilis, Strain MM31A-1" /LENGTH=354 /DNA_ID=CAMNT_0038803873 /DNA_START=124 /DNA_END=1185 /DNA_ORIENTATION=-
MAATESFTDQVFLANWGLSRITVLDFFCHPLNPFKVKEGNSCNEILAMQGTSIGLIMQNGIGMRPGPMSLPRAEEEYRVALSRLTGHQYELMPAAPISINPAVGGGGGGGPGNGNNANAASNSNSNSNPADANGDGGAAAGQTEEELNFQMQMEQIQSPLFTIRHVYRHSPTKISSLGIYYILEGVIYKAPSARSLMKANVTRTCQGLIDACKVLGKCAKYAPRTGPYWDFVAGSGTGSGSGAAKKNTSGKSSGKKRSRSDEEDKDETEGDNDNDNDNEISNKDDEDDADDEGSSSGDNQANRESAQEILDDMRTRSRRVRRVLDNRPPGERTEEEEESIRAKEKINSILLRLK